MADPSEPTRPFSHRRRFLIGLALAALVAVGLGALLLSAARAGEARERAERHALVELSALTEVLERAAAAEAGTSEDTGSGLGDELSSLGVEEPAEEEPA
ncbi:MAG TPA: hypothetical protein VHN15_07945, partial [Thermoanaerobaculia bacterium]|nr:hypothetical protein [Thermoanaerobaculia bacterium]